MMEKISNSAPDSASKGNDTEVGFQFPATSFHRAFYAILDWLAHCLVVATILIGMRCLRYLFEFLWHGEEVKFFGYISVDELFLAADFFLLAGILIVGIFCVINAYRRGK